MKYLPLFILLLLVACTQEIEKTNMIPVENMTKSPAVLENILISDIPTQYTQTLLPLPYQQYPRTEAIIVTQILESGGGGFSQFDVIHIANAVVTECENVKGAKSVSKNDLFEMCVTQVATISGRAEDCTVLPDTKMASCLTKMATNRSNVAGCFLINRGEKTYDDEESFTNCIFQGIYTNPTPEGCAVLIRTVDGNLNLAENCQLGLVSNDLQPIECTTFQIPQNKDRCLSLTASKTGNVDQCAGVTDGWPRDQCRGYAASLTQTCDTLEDGSAKDYCYYEVARTKKDARYCSHILQIKDEEPGDISQISCYRTRMFHDKDISVCHDIVDTSVRETCYHQYSSVSNNIEGCQTIVGFPIIKANCILNLADRTNNKSLCDFIDPNINDGRRNVKEFCLQQT